MKERRKTWGVTGLLYPNHNTVPMRRQHFTCQGEGRNEVLGEEGGIWCCESRPGECSKPNS